MTSVCIPFAERIEPYFPDQRIRSRRDFPKFLELIRVSAFVHQYQRDKEAGRVIANAADYAIAKELFETCYSAGPDKALGELLAAAEYLAGTKVEFRACDLIERTGWGKTKTYELLKRAEELGCVVETETRGTYRFLRNSPVPRLDLPATV